MMGKRKNDAKRRGRVQFRKSDSDTPHALDAAYWLSDMLITRFGSSRTRVAIPTRIYSPHTRRTDA